MRAPSRTSIIAKVEKMRMTDPQGHKLHIKSSKYFIERNYLEGSEEEYGITEST